jgi:hypothetical protein
VLLAQFIFLQVCDLLTTVIFLSMGVAEGNPLVRLALEAARSCPAVGLLAVKAAALGCGWYAWSSGRHRLLGRINVLFAICVVWNAVAIVASLT